jgi:DeoR family transcriptional regulator, fructose operon transcriptional repressor
MMYPFERREKILEKLNREGQIKIDPDARLLGVSRATLHRDLEELERQGLVRKVRGGAVFTGSTQFETHFELRIKVNAAEKEEIARRAAGTVQDDTAIFLDHSTSALHLARELRNRHFRNLLLFTNSLAIPSEMAGKAGLQVILTGGVVESEFNALSGWRVIESLKRLNLHQIFASVGALSPELGLMTQIPFIYELLPAVLQFGREINILVDHSKFFKIGTYQIAPLGPSLRIFTDGGLPKALRARIEQRGPKIIL